MKSFNKCYIFISVCILYTYLIYKDLIPLTEVALDKDIMLVK